MHHQLDWPCLFLRWSRIITLVMSHLLTTPLPIVNVCSTCSFGLQTMLKFLKSLIFTARKDKLASTIRWRKASTKLCWCCSLQTWSVKHKLLILVSQPACPQKWIHVSWDKNSAPFSMCDYWTKFCDFRPCKHDKPCNLLLSFRNSPTPTNPFLFMLVCHFYCKIGERTWCAWPKNAKMISAE